MAIGRSSHAIPTNCANSISARSRNPTVCIKTTREACERMRVSSRPVSNGFRLWNGTQQSGRPAERFAGSRDVE